MSPESTAPSGQALPAGTRLEEFEVERVLGTGGFGITYLARDVKLGRQVVIKENLPAQFAFRDPTSLTVSPRNTVGEDAGNFAWSLENFSREASMLASLDHPGIVPVMRSFEAFGTSYFVMPYMEGLPLDELMKNRRERGEEISDDELRGLLEHVLDALGYLHSRGIYHRDIKPGNILVTKEGVPILIDFGSARQRLSERSMTVVESAGYTPFEQLQSRGNVGPWSDLYALGATVSKAITGEAPPKAMDRMRNDPYEPLSRRPNLRERYSETLLSSIDRALEVEESVRWQDAGQWQQALRVAEDPPPPVAVVPPPPEAPARTMGFPGPGVAGSPRVQLPVGGKKKSKGVLVGVGLVAVLVMGGVALVMSGNDREEKGMSQAELREKEEEAARKKAEEELAAQKKAEEERKRREAVIRKALELVVVGEKVAPDFFVHVDREILSSAAEEGDPRAQSVWGSLHHSRYGLLNDDEEALKWYRKAAEQGDAEGQRNLGLMYMDGLGVAKDKEKAVEWFRRAAQQGSARGQMILGGAYLIGRGVAVDEKEAVKWFRKAAEQDYAKAQSYLGSMYEGGLGVAKDEKEALKWYRKAAEQGNASAQASLGGMYATGSGVAKDEAEAVKWYRKAADQGNAWGQNNLAEMYELGLGVAKDEAEAVKWYRKAAEQGNADAQANLGLMYAGGRGVAKDEAEALKWYRKAAEQGNASAQASLGGMYATGSGVAKDEAEAVKWYRKAAEQDLAIAQYQIGLMYSDSPESAKWYHKAADQGYVEAQLKLGMMYANGQGVAKDEKEAVEWFRKAAKQGVEDAKAALRELGASE